MLLVFIWALGCVFIILIAVLYAEIKDASLQRPERIKGAISLISLLITLLIGFAIYPGLSKLANRLSPEHLWPQRVIKIGFCILTIYSISTIEKRLTKKLLAGLKRRD